MEQEENLTGTVGTSTLCCRSSPSPVFYPHPTLTFLPTLIPRPSSLDQEGKSKGKETFYPIFILSEILPDLLDSCPTLSPPIYYLLNEPRLYYEL